MATESNAGQNGIMGVLLSADSYHALLAARTELEQLKARVGDLTRQLQEMTEDRDRFKRACYGMARELIPMGELEAMPLEDCGVPLDQVLREFEADRGPSGRDEVKPDVIQDEGFDLPPGTW